jgi:hypothetical protein
MPFVILEMDLFDAFQSMPQASLRHYTHFAAVALCRTTLAHFAINIESIF